MQLPFGRKKSHDPLDRFRLDGQPAPTPARSAQPPVAAGVGGGAPGPGKARRRWLIAIAVLALIGLSWAVNPPVGKNHAFSCSG